MNFDDKVLQRLDFLYGSDQKQELLDQIKKQIFDHGFSISASPAERSAWDQEDAIIITYGDVILPRNGSADKLQTLEAFVNTYVGDAVNTIHILPFFPSSSDQGFSVIDYLQVREDLGDWKDIEHFSEQYNIMADLVINHTSRFSDWFENYQMNKEPGKDYFIEVDPSIDLSSVTRPRSTPLLSSVKTNRGLKYVWTTFSDDQIDLDFTNPEVLLEFIDIFLFYISKGISLIRLDAIAYLWKEIGTNSIHLQETHQVIKLFRDIIDHVNPDITLITETNVPFDENINYFGDGDEAHMIYQFSLPPLLLHALLTENGEFLTHWAQQLPEPPSGCTYFNFTASHDGIGVRPLEGLVPDEEFDYLIKSTQERGGFVSYKQNADSSQSPYELNITYFDAFAEPGQKDTQMQLERYFCSQAIMLSLQGIPGIYFHNLTATKNDVKSVSKTGKKRAINRKQWPEEELEKHLEKSRDVTHYVLERYKKLLQTRKKHPSFSPEAGQSVLDYGDDFFVLIRRSEQPEETIVCISNLTHQHQRIDRAALPDILEGEAVTNLIDGEKREVSPALKVKPFETVWLIA